MTESRSRILLIFISTLIVGLLIQTTLWSIFPVADNEYWAGDARKLAEGHMPTSADVTYVHPGTTILSPMAALVSFGVEPKEAVRLAMAAFIALCIALAATIAYQLWPAHLRWLALACILIPDVRLLHGTPPSTAAALLTVLFVLLLLYAKKRKNETNWKPLAYAGVCAGALLATRIDTGIFMLLAALPIALYTFKKRAYVLLVASAGAFAVLNPYLWVGPLTYLESIPRQIFSNTQLVGRKIFGMFLLTFPFAILSIGLSIIAARLRLLHPPADDVPLSLALYGWFLGTTALFPALLIPLSYHPVRYFLPFYLVWDILLPVWLFVLAPRALTPRVPWVTPRRCEWLVVTSILVIMMIQILLLAITDVKAIIL